MSIPFSKSTEIAEILKTELEAGKYPKGSRFPSEGELADRFVVGTATANRAVCKLEQMGYLGRKGSRRNGMRVIRTNLHPKNFIFCPMSIDSEFQQQILKGVIRAAFSLNYAVVPFPFYDSDSQEVYSEFTESGRFAGVLSLVPIEFNTHLPIVYADVSNLDHLSNTGHVRGNLKEGTRLLIEYLQKSGHRKFAYCHSSKNILSNVPRRIAFLECMKKCGIRNPGQYLFPAVEISSYHMKQTLQTILAKYPDTDAILCETDDDAFIMKRIIQSMPEKNHIAVTGFGNLKSIQKYLPFPTIDQHPEETGFRAALKLIHRIENPEEPWERIDELPVELIIPGVIS